jgi:hypothetical protein
MNYLPDPGGQFASNVHRRTVGHLPLPDEEGTSVAALFNRMVPDLYSPFGTESELLEVLESLRVDGLAEKVDELWRQTTAGTERLTGPNAEEPPPLKGAALEAAEAADAERAVEDEATIKQAKADRIERLKAELKEAENA